ALIDFCFKYNIKVNGSDLSNLMRRLFAAEIEHEKNQRRSEPGGPAAKRSDVEKKSQRFEAKSSQDLSAPSTAPELGVQIASDNTVSPSEITDETPRLDPNYRFRDGSGLVFGPMGQKTLCDFLRARRPRPEDRVSVNEGPWTEIENVKDLDLKTILRVDVDQPERHVPVDAAKVLAAKDLAVKGLGEESSVGSKDTDIIRDLKEALHGMEEFSQPEDARPMGSLSRNNANLGLGSEGLQDASSMASQSAPSIPIPEIDGLDGQTFQELREQYASYEGNLRNVSMARILARLDSSNSTGRLHVQHEDSEKSIYVREGEPIFVDSDRKDELLGNFLITRDIISQGQLQEALARLNEWGGRLGDALVAIGAIPAHEIFQHLSDQMREKILEVFTWTEGYYGYYENQEPTVQGYSLGLETYDTIVVGCRERISLERIKDIYRNRAHVAIYPREPPPVDIDRLKLRAKELRVLNQLAPGENLNSLLTKFSDEQQEMVYRTIHMLHQVEFITFEVTEKFDLPEA
ncbi:MAG: DUF4388 domain-containing protein, partial [Bradymonadaceae bacterium]